MPVKGTMTNPDIKKKKSSTFIKIKSSYNEECEAVLKWLSESSVFN